jgi:hypothetical protein
MTQPRDPKQREIAAQMERDFSDNGQQRWLVMWLPYLREYAAFATFGSKPMAIRGKDPNELAAQLREYQLEQAIQGIANPSELAEIHPQQSQRELR